jgi:hypothetical protein
MFAYIRDAAALLVVTSLVATVALWSEVMRAVA